MEILRIIIIIILDIFLCTHMLVQGIRKYNRKQGLKDASEGLKDANEGLKNASARRLLNLNGLTKEFLIELGVN